MWQQHGAPDVGEVLDIAVVGQQLLDPEKPFVRPTVVEEIASRGEIRDAAGNIQVSTADELAIAGSTGRFDALGVQGGRDVLVDAGGQGFGLFQVARLHPAGLTS